MKSFFLCTLFFFACGAPKAKISHKVQITEKKIVQLIPLPQAKKPFEAPSGSEQDYSKGIIDFPNLGMNNVPVLDQGQYGTCVTFSTTAALDAILGQGDFISQQCSLDLDYGLGNDYWDGAMYPSQIVSPLQQYGVVSKEACPRQYAVPYFDYDSDDYQEIIDESASAAIKSVQLNYTASASLPAVKKGIDAGHRVLLAFTLDSTSSEAVRGFNLKVDGKSYAGGLWACQQGKSVNHCVSSNAGHEVVVIGYDDKQQLLQIRNSWDADVGYQGNYFMTYKFFQTMGADVTEIY